MHIHAVNFNRRRFKKTVVYIEGHKRGEVDISSVHWAQWNSQHAVDIFRQVHALQHDLLEIVEEPGKGLGLRLKRDVPEGTLIATGLAPMMDREEEEDKFIKYVQRHTDWSTWTEETAADDEIRPQYYAADINDESLISVGCMDPSDHNYKLSVDRAKQVGLYWWANEPSDTYQVEEHCNVVCGAFKICTGTYAVVLATLTDLPAGAFIHTNYGGSITRHGYKSGVCLSGLECWHCHSSINFPLLHYQDRTTLLNSPRTFEPVVISRPLRDPTYRPLHRTFTMACIGYEEQRAKRLKSNPPITFTAVPRCWRKKLVNRELVFDIVGETIPDGTSFVSSTSLIKTWTMANCGIEAWPAGMSVTHAAGHSYGLENIKFRLPFVVHPGDGVCVSFAFKTPNVEGKVRTEFKFVYSDDDGPKSESESQSSNSSNNSQEDSTFWFEIHVV